MRRVKFATHLTAAVLTLCLAVLLQRMSSAADAAGTVSVQGTYVNSEYGFSTQVPLGLHAFRLGPPAPNHGIGINLKGESGSYVWINGEYDALMLGDLAALADSEASSFCREYGLKIIGTRSTHMAGLDAIETELQSQKAEPGAVNYLRFTVTLAPRNGETGIVLLAGLRQKSRDASADRVLSAIIASVRLGGRTK